MLRSIHSVHKITFLEIARHPAYYLITAITAFIIFISQKVVVFDFNSNLNMIRELGVSTLVLWGVFTCILFTQQSVFVEIENRCAMTLMAKPIRRFEYVLGKYFGLLRALFTGLLFLTIILMLTLWMDEGIPKLHRMGFKASTAVHHLVFHEAPGNSLEGPVFALGGPSVSAALLAAASTPREITWDYLFINFCSSNIWPVLIFSFLAFVHSAMIASFALALATFFTTVVVASGTLAFYLVGHLADYMAKGMPDAGIPALIVRQFMRCVLPNLEYFNPAEHIAQGEQLSAIYVALSLLYGILYVSLVLGMTSFAFSRRELP